MNKRYNYILEALEKFILKFEDPYIVDCACGDGTNSKVVRDEGHRMIGFDISKKTVSKAKNNGMDAIVASILNLPLDDEVADIFICSETLEHLNNEETISAVKEIKRIVKTNGFVVITVPENKKLCLANPLHRQYLSKIDVISLFDDFENVFQGIFCKKPNRCNTVLIFEKKVETSI